MRCLVTGASGFLGSWLVRGLLQHGHSVTALVRTTSDLRRIESCRADIRLLYGSLDEPEALRAAISGNYFDAAFHLAWCGVTAGFRNHPAQLSVNVTGTVRLWELARAAGCKHWIGLGSQAEYGIPTEVLTEDSPTHPVTAYGVAKLATGMVTQKMSECVGMQHSWIRLLSAYGPGDDEKHMTPAVINSLLRHERPALTKGEQRWDYLYVEDAAEALCQVLHSGAGGTFNLSSGRSITIRELVEMIRDEIDPSLPIGFGELPYRDDQVMRLEGDISRISAATGWRPAVEIREGIRKTIEYCRAQMPDYATR